MAEGIPYRDTTNDRRTMRDKTNCYLPFANCLFAICWLCLRPRIQIHVADVGGFRRNHYFADSLLAVVGNGEREDACWKVAEDKSAVRAGLGFQGQFL